MRAEQPKLGHNYNTPRCDCFWMYRWQPTYLRHSERMGTIQTRSSNETHYTYDVCSRLTPRSTPGHLLHMG
jgi:hypothetical protein